MRVVSIVWADTSLVRGVAQCDWRTRIHIIVNPAATRSRAQTTDLRRSFRNPHGPRRSGERGEERALAYVAAGIRCSERNLYNTWNLEPRNASGPGPQISDRFSHAIRPSCRPFTAQTHTRWESRTSRNGQRHSEPDC